MARIPLHSLEEALIGCMFEKAAVEEVMASFPIEEMFGELTQGEILTLMFSAFIDFSTPIR